MKLLSENNQQAILDEVFEKYQSFGHLISIELNYENQIQIRYLDGSFGIHLLKDSQIFTKVIENEIFEFEIKVSAGPKIKESIGDIRMHPPFKSSDTINYDTMGGDQVRNTRNMNKYGTVSFYAAYIEWESRGLCNINCNTRPAMVSNNHVIALSDSGQIGDIIWTPFRPDIAILDCALPLRCSTTSDIAFAKIINTTGVINCQIRQIGSFIIYFRRPIIGERIHKYGARTGYTTGTITGISNIRVGNILYRGVYVTSQGFGCPGDSGSTVIAMNSFNDPLGLYTWGDDIPCEQNPKGYFFAFPPSQILDNEENVIYQSLKVEA